MKFRGFDKKLFRTVFSYSFFVFLTQIVDQINWRADQFILGMVSGTIAVAIYSAASQINTMFINLSVAVSGVMLPKISKMVARKASNEVLTNEMIKIGRIQFLIIFLVASGFVLVGKEFMTQWLGSDFIESYYVTLLLILPAILSLIQNTGLAIMQAMNKFKFKAMSTFIMALINIVLSIFLAKAYGAIGAAFGTTLSIIVCNVIVMNIYYKCVIKLDVWKFWKEILVMFIKFVIPIGLTVGLIYLTNMHGWFAVLLYGGFYVIMYSVVAYLFVINKYERNLINSFLKKIHLMRR